jgi:hypothetical protein
LHFQLYIETVELGNWSFFVHIVKAYGGSGDTVPFIVLLRTSLKLAVGFTLRPFDPVEGDSENEIIEQQPNTGPPILLMVTSCIFVSFGGISAVRLFYLVPGGGVRYE